MMERLPQYSWNQILSVVDRLTRHKRIVLRRHGFTYTLFSIHYRAGDPLKTPKSPNYGS
jgi:hypothetical protein